MPLNRRQWLASSLAAPFVNRLYAQQGGQRPNLVFLLVDDLRWDALGCMGNTIIQTPEVDRLAERGVTFTNAFVTTSICMTSRASIFLGQYARTHKINDFATPFTPRAVRQYLPAVLRRAGYHAGFIGKYGVGNQMPEDEFDYWRGFPGQGRYFPDGEPGPHLTERMGDQALQFFETAPSNKPFCLSISYKAVHVQDEDPRQFLPSPATANLYRDAHIPVPKTAAPRYIAQLPIEVQRSEGRRRWAVRFGTPELYQESVKNYYRLMTEVDTTVGRIRKGLERMGAADNTVIVFTSDNGFYLAEHGLAGKWLMHEESIRIPLIVFDPRLPERTRGQRLPHLALNIDLAPTLLDAAGLASPSTMQGRSLYPLMRGQRIGWREDFFYEHEFTARGWIPQTEGVRTARWKYTHYPTTQPEFEELYDLENDTLEENNLVRDPAAARQLETLRRHHESWRNRLDAWKEGPVTGP
jgi:arylsulfatase A-like enzyme